VAGESISQNVPAERYRLGARLSSPSASRSATGLAWSPAARGMRLRGTGWQPSARRSVKTMGSQDNHPSVNGSSRPSRTYWERRDSSRVRGFRGAVTPSSQKCGMTPPAPVPHFTRNKYDSHSGSWEGDFLYARPQSMRCFACDARGRFESSSLAATVESQSTAADQVNTIQLSPRQPGALSIMPRDAGRAADLHRRTGSNRGPGLARRMANTGLCSPNIPIIFVKHAPAGSTRLLAGSKYAATEIGPRCPPAQEAPNHRRGMLDVSSGHAQLRPR